MEEVHYSDLIEEATRSLFTNESDIHLIGNLLSKCNIDNKSKYTELDAWIPNYIRIAKDPDDKVLDHIDPELLLDRSERIELLRYKVNPNVKPKFSMEQISIRCSIAKKFKEITYMILQVTENRNRILYDYYPLHNMYCIVCDQYCSINSIAPETCISNDNYCRIYHLGYIDDVPYAYIYYYWFGTYTETKIPVKDLRKVEWDVVLNDKFDYKHHSRIGLFLDPLGPYMRNKTLNENGHIMYMKVSNYVMYKVDKAINNVNCNVNHVNYSVSKKTNYKQDLADFTKLLLNTKEHYNHYKMPEIKV